MTDIKQLIKNKKQIPEWDKDMAITKIKNGMTNQNYLCTLCSDKKYVVRIPGNSTFTLVDRSAEWNNHQQIEKVGIDVETIFFEKKTGIKVTSFIQDTFAALQTNMEKIPFVCTALKKIHCSNLTFENKFWIAEKLDHYEGLAVGCSAVVDQKYYGIKEKLQGMKITDFLLEYMNWSPCHNDPVFDNFLLSKEQKIYLIDWEYSGMNDVHWDLAAVSLENNFSPIEDRQLLDCYFGEFKHDKKNQHIMFLYKIYQDILWYLWAEIKIRSGSSLSQYATHRLNRANYNVNKLSLSRQIKDVNLQYHPY